MEGLARFQSPLFFDTPQSSQKQVWDKRGDKISNREVSHKLIGELSLGGTLCHSHFSCICIRFKAGKMSLRKQCGFIQFSSVSQSCPILCDPMNRSTPGLPVHHQLPEFTQTHVHWVSDAIEPSHPLLSPSPPAPNPSQHQSLFQWVNSSHEVAKVLEFQL